MLPSSPHVSSVYLDKGNGLLGGLKNGVCVIDSSTIDPKTSRMVSETVMERSAKNLCLDAPVSGGIFLYHKIFINKGLEVQRPVH